MFVPSNSVDEQCTEPSVCQNARPGLTKRPGRRRSAAAAVRRGPDFYFFITSLDHQGDPLLEPQADLDLDPQVEAQAEH